MLQHVSMSGKNIRDRGGNAADRKAAPTHDQKAMNHLRPASSAFSEIADHVMHAWGEDFVAALAAIAAPYKAPATTKTTRTTSKRPAPPEG
jgi:hypothetical protein